MSRVEENQEMLEKVPKGFNGAYERVNNAVLIAQLYVLKDISKSLAVIADAEEEFLHSETEPPINPMEVLKGVKTQ